MAEIGVTVAGLDLRDQASLLVERLPLECHRVKRFVFGDRVDIHVGKRRGDQFRGGETLVEEFALAEFVHEVFRDHFARAVMHGIVLQHLGFECPVLHDLRRQFDEIALDLREAAVFHVVKQEVERMAEFVEERFRLVERQQCGRIAYRAREVADNTHHGRHALAVLIGLLDIVAAPGALALAVAGEIVEIEHTQVRAIGIEHLVGDRIGMVERHDDRLEGDAVEAVGQVEDAALHVLEREVGTQHLLVEGIILLAQLLGVIPPVPRFEGGTGDVLLQKRVHLGQLALGAFERRRPDLVEQAVNGIGRTGHLVRHDIGGVRGIAQQVCLLRAQADEIVDELLVVVFVAVIATVQISLIDLLAQVAPGGIGQQRDQAGLVEREDPLVALAHLPGLLAGGVADACRQPVEFVRLEFEHEIVVFGEDVIPEFHGRERQLPVDLFQAGLLLGVEQRPGAHEGVVGFLQQTHLLGVEPQRRTPVVNLLHTDEELVVEADLVPVRGQQGHGLLLQGLHAVVGFSGTQHAEHQFGLREHLPGIVIGKDRIFERGLVLVRGDGVDLGLVQRHAAFEGGHEMLGQDLVERRHAVRRIPFGEKRVFPGRFPGIA